jgi:hypothetical protein
MRACRRSLGLIWSATLAGIREYFEAGYDHVHQIGPRLKGSSELCGRKILPKLKC